jgi:hypothetical protein
MEVARMIVILQGRDHLCRSHRAAPSHPATWRYSSPQSATPVPVSKRNARHDDRASNRPIALRLLARRARPYCRRPYLRCTERRSCVQRLPINTRTALMLKSGTVRGAWASYRASLSLLISKIRPLGTAASHCCGVGRLVSGSHHQRWKWRQTGRPMTNSR